MKRNNKYLLLSFIATVGLLLSGCDKDKLAELYPNPQKTSVATVDNFFTGVLKSANQVVMPWYWRFFVVEQPTMGHYTQVMGWFNGKDQYIPPAAAMDWRWGQYYNGVMTQYREMQRLYDKLNETDKSDYRIFMLAATIFFYDQTEQVVDIYGDIPWSKAGMVRDEGDLKASLPPYDKAEDIYNAMLDDLKYLAEVLDTIHVPSFYANLFADKDYLNDGDLTIWKKYCNSLRLRMLLRVSAVPEFQARVQQEMTEILSDPAKYPVIDNNDENVMLDAGGPDLYATTSSMHGGIWQAMATWGQYDLAPYALVDHMVTHHDPRLEITFDPNVEGVYVGVDPLEDASTQSQKASDGLVARYDSSTFMRNHYFPGFVISAAEVSFIKAEVLLKGGQDALAKAAYEQGVRQSIEFYYNINATGDYRDPIPMNQDSVDAYLTMPGVSWDQAADDDAKMTLIAEQKWINSGLGGMPQTWAEVRRLDKPVFYFMKDTQSGQNWPPVRWLYPESEKKLNAENYAAVKDKDDLNTRVFWDVNPPVFPEP